MAWRQGFRLKCKVCLPGSYPFRQSLRLCHLPQGDGFSGGGKLCGNAERRPLGGAGERSETEGVLPAIILVLPPQRRAFTESGAAAAVSRYDPFREKAILENPQIFQNCEIINNLSAEYAQQRRRPPPVAETGRSCWGSGQQDASAAQGTLRMLGAATRKKRSAFKIVSRASARYAHPLFCVRKVWYTENSILCPEGG